MLSFLVLLAVFGLPGSLGSNNVYHLNERDFEGYIRDKDIMLVDFFAPWCHHCQELNPELDAAADHLATTKNQYVFAKVDCVDGAPQLCQRFNIQGYPTIKLFKYGQYVGDYVGQRDRNSLMQYVDSVATTMSQHSPLSSGATTPATLAQAINNKPQAPVFPSHHASSIYAPAQAIAPTYIHQANTHIKNPSLLASFYGSPAHAQHPQHVAPFLTPPLPQASPDSLQSKFGNMASLDIYRSKLKMIAAYKNYQRRLKEYRRKLTAANKAKVNPSPQGYAGAVTQPPRPGVNAFAHPQTYRGYYRPEAMAAQNVQINRAVPQGGYSAYTSNYPYQFASPYGYQALASSPYYRSKMSHGRKRQHGKHRGPAPRPVGHVRNPAYNRRPGRVQVANYYKQQQFQQKQLQQRFHQQPQQQQQQQQFRQQQQQQQQQQQFHQDQQQEQQQQQQQQFQQELPTKQQDQAHNKPQAPQPVASPAVSSLGQSNDELKTSDTSALKDLKADIESAIQDALKNAVSKESDKPRPSPAVHVDGERAKSQSTTAHLDQAASGSGAQSQSSSAHGSGNGDAAAGEGSGSGVKSDSS